MEIELGVSQAVFVPLAKRLNYDNYKSLYKDRMPYFSHNNSLKVPNNSLYPNEKLTNSL